MFLTEKREEDIYKLNLRIIDNLQLASTLLISAV